MRRHRVAPPLAAAAAAAKGFRPFFLLASLFVALAVPVWIAAFSGKLAPSAYLDATYWHAHEMVFGFTVAVIAGFLLTAVGNWTGRETAVGLPLVGLAALWLAGRLALVLPIPHILVAVVDLAFLPALALVLGRALVGATNRRNYVMLVVLGALFLSNLAVHLDVAGYFPGGRRTGALVGIDIVITLIAIIVGRVLPMFTRNATGVASIRSHRVLDIAAIFSLVALTLADVAGATAEVTAVIAGAAAIAAVARAVHWGTRHTWREPLLWILHAGYAWLPIGLALRAASGAGLVPSTLGTHALTTGTIGALTLGMMARVSLGHTGRPLVVGRAMQASFVLVTAAAFVRTIVPMLDDRVYSTVILASGVLFSGAFAIFAATYAPTLLSPRADGKPG